MISTRFQNVQQEQAKSRLYLLLLLYGVVLTAVAAVAMWFPVYFSPITHIILPLGVLFFKGMETVFGAVKLGTLVVVRGLILLACFGIGDSMIATVGWWLLFINVFEAVCMDFLKKEYLNLVIGVGLLAALFPLELGWENNTLIIPASFIFWILAHTLWDWLIVLRHLEEPYGLGHIVILLSPIAFIVLVQDITYWLVMRELTLCLGISSLALGRTQLKKAVYQAFPKQQMGQFKSFIFSTKVQLCFFTVNFMLLLLQFIYH